MVGESARLRLIFNIDTSGLSSFGPDAGSTTNQWQNLVARWTLCVSRVSIQNCNPSLSSKSEWRHQRACFLVVTATVDQKAGVVPANSYVGEVVLVFKASQVR